jgi:hypothetical protein
VRSKHPMAGRSDAPRRFGIPDLIHPIHDFDPCIAHQRATKALASVASVKQIARTSFTTPRVLDGVEVHPSAPQFASSHAFI